VLDRLLKVSKGVLGSKNDENSVNGSISLFCFYLF